MSTFSKDQLRSLANLAALQLSENEIEHLGGQLEAIIAFVGQLSECDLSECAAVSQVHEDAVLVPRSEWANFTEHEKILSNSQHLDAGSRSLRIKTSTQRV